MDTGQHVTEEPKPPFRYGISYCISLALLALRGAGSFDSLDSFDYPARGMLVPVPEVAHQLVCCQSVTYCITALTLIHLLSFSVRCQLHS